METEKHEAGSGRTVERVGEFIVSKKDKEDADSKLGDLKRGMKVTVSVSRLSNTSSNIDFKRFTPKSNTCLLGVI